MIDIKGFLEEVRQVWDTGILGTNLGDILIAFGVFIVFLFGSSPNRVGKN